jgi:hypothetical protein
MLGEIPNETLQKGVQMLPGAYTLRETPAFRRRVREQAVSLEVVMEALGVPAVVRPTHEPHVLYVRVAALRSPSSRMVSVEPGLGVQVASSLRTEGQAVERAVIVGADSVVHACVQDASPGNQAGMQALIDVVRALVDADVPFVWRTRAGLPAKHTELPTALFACLQSAGRLCVVESGIPTLEDDLAHALEGARAVPPRDRLRLMHALTSRQIDVRALIDPLVPLLTDQQAPLSELLRALADVGVKHVATRYVVLTRERAKLIAERLVGMQRALLQGVFADEPWRSPDEDTGARELHKRIPGPLRRQGHERALETGAALGLRVDILDPADEPEVLTSVPSHRLPKARVRPQLDLFRKREP